MYLYNLTLQRASGVTHSVHGNFSGAKLQEIVVSRGKTLELLKPDPNTGKVHTLLSVEVFGVIRALMAFRLTKGTKGKPKEMYQYVPFLHVMSLLSPFHRLHYCRLRLWTDRHPRVQPGQKLLRPRPYGDIWQVRLPPNRPRSVPGSRP